ncbi:MAG: hypothetical protein FWD16_07480, partial [Clostridia bacterium]|nr:hypothetical protein [Clostridia bacterium]
MTYGILYSNAVQNLISKETVHKALGTGEFICADNLGSDTLNNIDVLVSCMGRYYPEEGFAHLYAFYQSGGALVTFGGQPLTIPYSICPGGASRRADGNSAEFSSVDARIHAETHAAIHSLYIIDGYRPTGAIAPGWKPTALGPRFAFLNDFAWPEITQTYSTYYHFAEHGMPGSIGYELDPIVDGQAEFGVAWLDESGIRKAVPLSYIEHYTRGAVVLANFDVADNGFYGTAQGQQLIKGLAELPKYGKYQFTARPGYGRYYENETPQINVALESLPAKATPGAQKIQITVELSTVGDNSIIQTFTISETNKTIDLPNLPEGYYKITAQVFTDDTKIITYQNGFYKYSDASVAKIMNNFAPVTVDPSISPDFLVRDGIPFPMHGANTFIT